MNGAPSREILMNTLRLRALEEHARAMLASIPGGYAPLVLTEFIGREYSLTQYPLTLAEARKMG